MTDPWQVDLAVRWEDFEDFGTTTNGKVATNYRFNDAFAVRGSWSTGFPGADAGQSNASNVTTQFDPDLNELVNQGTIPSTNPVAVLRGGEALEPEESDNFSVGAIVELGSFSLTADYYSIELDDRLAVSQDFELTPEEVDGAGGIWRHERGESQSFRFFTNDFDTETTGLDVVATYEADLFGGQSSLSLAFNNNQTEVKRFNPDTLNASRIRQLEEGLPETRWGLTGTQILGAAAAACTGELLRRLVRQRGRSGVRRWELHIRRRGRLHRLGLLVADRGRAESLRRVSGRESECCRRRRQQVQPVHTFRLQWRVLVRQADL